jgi:serine/threonine protein phosphatase 1
LINWIKSFFDRKPNSNTKQQIFVVENQSAIRVELPVYKFTDTNIRIAAFGDIHGRIDLLRKLSPALDTAAQDPARSLLEIYLGDYVDRGSNPKAVIDYLIERSNLNDRQVICLAGNHEQMMVEALNNDRDFKKWLDFGGQSTLLSYGVSPTHVGKDVAKIRQAFIAAVPQSHVDFLRNLSTSYNHAGFFFAHAGVRPNVSLTSQKDEDLLWIRNPFLTSFADFGAVVVHGHTPSAKPVFKLNRIGIDTGAYRTGVLTCLFITSEKVFVLDTAQARTL